jgi:hypothetical protein
VRKAEIALRKIIREELLSEVPLWDMPTVPGDSGTIPRSERLPAIGHPRTRSQAPEYRDEKYDEAAREIMSNTEDNWVIVTPDNVLDLNRYVNSSEFKSWLKEKDYPKGTVVIVVRSNQFSGDGSTPAWQIVHDIFGHTIEQYWFKHFSTEADFALINDLIPALHEALPDTFHLTAAVNDMMPDILGSIFVGRFPQEKAQDVVMGMAGHRDQAWIHQARRSVRSMFNAVKMWISDRRTAGVSIVTSF